MEYYTRSDKETANEMNQYFNTIGTPFNPNYKKSIKTDRERARILDKPYDFISKNHPNHQHELK